MGLIQWGTGAEGALLGLIGAILFCLSQLFATKTKKNNEIKFDSNKARDWGFYLLGGLLVGFLFGGLPDNPEPIQCAAGGLAWPTTIKALMLAWPAFKNVLRESLKEPDE